ncbi:MAG: O-antigen ligase family protein [Candidatus Marinimicrobia bacterium]|nr:O-antigen ligase family protein [Candidatus Neomarinimicrobiota bacterium]
MLSYIIYNSTNTESEIRKYFKIILISNIIPIVIGLLQIINNHTENFVYFLGRARITSIYYNSNEYGLILVVLMFMLLFLNNNKIIYNILLVAVVVSLMHTFSRTALFSAVISYTIIKYIDKKIYKILLLVFAFVVLFQLFSNSVFFERYTNADSMDSFQWRILQWKHTIRIFKESPLFGNGIETFYIDPSYGKYKTLSSAQAYLASTHNEYIKILVEMGIIGLIFYMAFFIKLLTKIAKNIPHNNKIIVAIPIMFLISSFTRNLIGVPILQLYYFIGLGITLRLYNYEDK